jgi:enoyl-CoA hydratase/carnithine racemase
LSNYDAYNGDLLVKKEGEVLSITLNRPEVRNAITHKMEEDMDDILDIAALDDEVKVVTIMGAGKVFSAGHDLKEVAQGYIDNAKAGGSDDRRQRRLRGMWYFPKPIVCGVHEFVGPIAQDLVAHCDFVIAAENTKFSFEQARMGAGVIAWSPLTFMFPMRVYKKLMMTGGWYTGEQALKWDFVQRVVPREDLENTVAAWAKEICLVPPQQTRAAKMGIHRQYELRGLVNMALVGNRESGHGAEVDREFFRRVQQDLPAALKFRNDGSDPTITQI